MLTRSYAQSPPRPPQTPPFRTQNAGFKIYAMPHGRVTHVSILVMRADPWAARYNTELLNKLTPKGAVFSFLFFSFLFFSFLFFSFLFFSFMRAGSHELYRDPELLTAFAQSRAVSQYVMVGYHSKLIA